MHSPLDEFGLCLVYWGVTKIGGDQKAAEPESEEMVMSRAISILAVTALIPFLAATDTSFAATKKKAAAQTENCLGGGCQAVNPDRTRPDYYSSYYKRSSKTKKSSDKTSDK
jgi:hypothetical protein